MTYPPQNQPEYQPQEPGTPPHPGPTLAQPEAFNPYQQPQQPFGQQQTGGYQQQGGGYQQPGQFSQPQNPYSYPQPGMYPYPPQQKSPLPWILGGTGVIVVIGVIVALVLTMGGGSSGGASGGAAANSSDPKAVAQGYVDALNNKANPTGFLCQGDLHITSPSLPSQISPPPTSINFTATWTLKDVSVNGDKASATIDTLINNTPPAHTAKVPMIKESGNWKICRSAGTSSSGTGGGSSSGYGSSTSDN